MYLIDLLERTSEQGLVVVVKKEEAEVNDLTLNYVNCTLICDKKK